MNKLDRQEAQKRIQAYAMRLWDQYCEIFPALVKFDCPTVILNGRLTRTAGRCFQHENKIDLGLKFVSQHWETMLREILPHELAHQIDFNLYGESEKKCGHGKKWVMVMQKIGLEPKKFHSMIVK